MSVEQGGIIAVDGPGGSGKTHLADELAGFYGIDPQRQIIHADHYFEPADKPGVVAVEGLPGGFNVARFMEQVGAALKDEDRPMVVEEYDWETDAYAERTPPNRSQLIVVEGIKLIGLPVDWDVPVWVQTPSALRRRRFLDRHVSERRMKETDPVALLERFDLWADDAETYFREVVGPKGDKVLVVQGDEPATRAIEEIHRALIYGTGNRG